MLEPFLRPKPAITLYGITSVLAVLAFVTSFTLGTVSTTLVAPVLLVFSILRIAGLMRARREGQDRMPWGHRFASWGVIALPLVVTGAAASLGFLLPFLIYVGLDTAGGVSRKRPGAAVDDDDDRPGLARRAWERISGTLFPATLVVAFLLWHFLFALSQSWTALADWGAIAVLVALYLRVAMLPGKRAREEAARAPAHHRLHVAEDRPLPDPAARGLARGLEEFLRDGNVESLTWSARAVASARGLPPEEGRELEARLVELVTRPRTRRENDLEDATGFIEHAAIAAKAVPRDPAAPAPRTEGSL